MNCPRCDVELAVEQLRGIEVDRCPKCQGMWLDYQELDLVEDTVLDQDEAKGTMVFRSWQGELHCPHCRGPLQMFYYRGYDLELDFCPQQHGFWLDKGEEERVRQLMAQRVKDLKRSGAAEVEWAGLLGRIKSRSFGQRMKDLFKR